MKCDEWTHGWTHGWTQGRTDVKVEIIMYGIGIIFLTIATHISFSDVLSRDKDLRDKEEDL